MQRAPLRFRYLVYALRPSHWIKNLFIFAPLVFGGKLLSYPETLAVISAFCLFSLASSTGYLLNDLFDLHTDRLHPWKRLRPLASGKLNKRDAQWASLFLGAATILSALLWNQALAWVIGFYIGFNMIYSQFLKKMLIIDVFCLSVFFLLRLIAGCVVTEIELSPWIVVLTTQMALFLGFTKRRQELRLLKAKAGQFRESLAQYSQYFIDQMVAVITSTIVVAYILYTFDNRTVSQFGTTSLIYTAPFVYYGIFRYLYLIHKLHKDGDPVRMFFFDRKLQINIALWFVTVVVIIYGRF